jgi:hypothetical protein
MKDDEEVVVGKRLEKKRERWLLTSESDDIDGA